MNGAIRGMRWRAALMIVALVVVVLWRWASGPWGPVLRIDYQMVGPLLEGAEVIIDGHVAGTLESIGRQFATGFRTERGTHVVVVRTPQCASRPDTVVVGTGGSRMAVLVADIEDGHECRVLLRD
jgi:hypothetical protein